MEASKNLGSAQKIMEELQRRLGEVDQESLTQRKIREDKDRQDADDRQAILKQLADMGITGITL